MPGRHLSDEQLSAQLDDALGEEESAAAESHLQECADCVARRDLLRATSQAVASLPAEDLPRPIDLGFLRDASHRGAPTAPRGFAARVIHGRPPVWLPAAAAAAAVVVLSFTVAPRLLPGTGGSSQTTASQAGNHAAAAPGAGRDSVQATQPPPGTTGGYGLSGAAPGFLPPQEGAGNAVRGAEGSTVTILASPTTGSSGHPIQVLLRLAAGPSGTALASQGMELFISQGSTQVPLAAAAGTTAQVKAGDVLSLTAEWSAGTLTGPPTPGAYSLVGRVFLAGGHLLEVRLPFVVSS